MRLNEITGEILESCILIHQKLGPGLFESVYEKVLIKELMDKGLDIRSQVGIPVYWDNIKIDHGFRADIIVENRVLLELKSIDVIAPVHKKQVLTYRKLANLPIGLLINFHEMLLKDGVTRLINNDLQIN